MGSELYCSVVSDTALQASLQTVTSGPQSPPGARNVRMHEVRYFVILAKTLNFTRGAALANVSQPAFSRAIANLESKLGGHLVVRGTGKVALSALGKSVLPSLAQCLDLVAGVEFAALTRTRPARAFMRIAIANSVGISSLATALAPPTVGSSRTTTIEIQRLDGADCLDALGRGDCDFAVAPEISTRAHHFVATAIYTDHLGLLAPSTHPIFANERPGLSDIGTALLVDRRYCEHHTAISGGLVNSGKVPARRISISCDDQLAPLQGAVDALAIAPSSLCGRSQRWCPIAGLRITRRVFVFERRGQHRTPAGQLLIEALTRTGKSAAPPVVNGVWSQEVPL